MQAFKASSHVARLCEDQLCKDQLSIGLMAHTDEALPTFGPLFAQLHFRIAVLVLQRCLQLMAVQYIAECPACTNAIHPIDEHSA